MADGAVQVARWAVRCVTGTWTGLHTLDVVIACSDLVVLWAGDAFTLVSTACVETDLILYASVSSR